MRKQWTMRDHKFLVENRDKMTREEAAIALGRSFKSVCGYCYRNKISFVKVGEKHATAKYSNERIARLRAAYKAEQEKPEEERKTVRQLASAHDFNLRYVYQIVGEHARYMDEV